MSFEIEHNVPMPTSQHGNEKYPFPTMKVGDSFSFRNDAVRVRSAANSYGRRKGLKFTIRCVDPIKSEYRCWRIA